MGFVKKKSGQYFRPYTKNRIQEMIKTNGRDILASQNHKATRYHIQHGNMSVRRHAIDVAIYSVLISERLRISCNKKELIRGALLHDYFLYDWHDKDHVQIFRLHGFFHPGIALQNAEKEYRLTSKEKDIIRKHMWPLTVVPPMCKEAWIVTMADKYCSLLETIKVHRAHRG